jgi:hypothetical protein
MHRGKEHGRTKRTIPHKYIHKPRRSKNNVVVFGRTISRKRLFEVIILIVIAAGISIFIFPSIFGQGSQGYSAGE